ncbi:hypothetical protein NPIL_559461 [Nephila pilipes]|uniref:Uncharacterized protein n=1 Tax=Nephila pilipes TaxID=299642 RepID=A0A8X6NU04_NEPPI|nr:hypothetical protein NPIL_559461 [Nephila pilipes]
MGEGMMMIIAPPPLFYVITVRRLSSSANGTFSNAKMLRNEISPPSPSLKAGANFLAEQKKEMAQYGFVMKTADRRFKEITLPEDIKTTN